MMGKQFSVPDFLSNIPFFNTVRKLQIFLTNASKTQINFVAIVTKSWLSRSDLFLLNNPGSINLYFFYFRFLVDDDGATISGFCG